MDEFIDYYEVLQISPKAELATIQRVYRMLAARYHPDNPATGNTDKFVLLQRAYSTLADPERRAAYDADYQSLRVQPIPAFTMKEFVVGIEAETNRRLGMLCLLYNRRRDDPECQSLSVFEFERMMSVPREHLEFTVWYLREKGYIRRDDHSELLITAEGVDYVEKHQAENPILRHLLKAPETPAGDFGRQSGSNGTPATGRDLN